MTTSLLELYRSMLLIRRVEERIIDEYAAQEMRCPVHLCIGQEAVASGVCAALEPTDKVMSGHRSHGHYLAKGGDLGRMIAEIYGKRSGCSLGKGGSMHLIDLTCGFLGSAPIVASTIPIGVGTAFAAKYRGEHRITAVFFGDAAVETGAFHESVNFALVHSLPVLFVCEDNLYSVYTPIEPRQPAGRGLAQLAAGMGMTTAKGDGNVVNDVVRLSETAINHARSGQGPYFLEFTTYRWREHCGPNFDNDIGYRTQAEFESWLALCPIEQCKSELISSRTSSDTELISIDHQLNDNINAAFKAAKSAPFPASHEALEQIFAN